VTATPRRVARMIVLLLVGVGLVTACARVTWPATGPDGAPLRCHRGDNGIECRPR
jgi:hypothetical protein